MNDTTLSRVKIALGIYTNALDNTLQIYIDEVVNFIVNAGVNNPENHIGLISRGVADLWQYGGGDGVLSPYFYQRVTQLRYGDD